MIITATIEVTEDRYRRAIAQGWLHRYTEVIEPGDIKSFDQPSYFLLAVNFIPTDSIKEIRITK
jgi:hypothetical protein